MTVQYKVFRSSFQNWDDIFADAARFAGTIDSRHLINISHSCDHSDSVVVVWYLDKPIDK